MSEYEVELFKEYGFRRKRCPSCGNIFWSMGDRERCGEPPCGEYSFIGNPPTKREFGLNEMREKFLKFFEDNGHIRINRYPIVARWRDDIFFSIASISCFQPWVLNGTIEPVANPLVMSQTSLRFNDIDNVGKTGRHFTEFEMMAHHAFNTKNNFVYFKDRTVELCHNFLLKLGINPEEIVYLEAEWSGGGNSGPCFEVIVNGVELATLVFMMYEETPSGKIEMNMKVVDTGYGLERFTWLSQGTLNAYEAVFPRVLEKLRNEIDIEMDERILSEYSKMAGMMNVENNTDITQLRKKVAERIGITLKKFISKIQVFENLYAISDHTRALMFMFNDGVVPSNVKEGYFARLLVRRTLRSLKTINLEMPIHEIIKWQMEDLKRYFPDLKKNREDILKLAMIEEKKYYDTIKRGKSIVKRLDGELKSKSIEEISIKNLVHLYDSHGLVPELVREFSKLKVKIPEDFYIKVAEMHTKPEVMDKQDRIKIHSKLSGLPATKLCYYENERVNEFNAEIIKILDDYIILDRTYFYPEGGGQEADSGSINGIDVIDVQKLGNVVIHRVRDPSSLKEGDTVRCKINWERRLQLMRHHTATHIINGAAKRVLGNHVWQAGAHKSENIGRLDITHYASLTDNELKRIEDLANNVIKEDRPIEKYFMNRNDAEMKYGFTIYQGGAVPGKEIRIVNIKDWDVEACGGTHLDTTGELKSLRIIRSKRIQDGVVRIEFKTGIALKRYEREIEEIASKIKFEHLSEEKIKEIASIFSVSISSLPSTLDRFRREWRENLKKIIALEKNLNKKGMFSNKYKEISFKDPVRDSKRLFEEWKYQRKDISRLQDEMKNIVQNEIERKFMSDFIRINNVKIVKEITHDLEIKNLNEIVNSTLRKNSLLIVGNIVGEKANLIVASDSEFDASEIARKICKMLNGNAHGNKRLAIGGGSSKNLKEIITKFRFQN